MTHALRCLVTALALFAATPVGCSGGSGSEASGCTKDLDCKGNRICERGACVAAVAIDATSEAAMSEARDGAAESISDGPTGNNAADVLSDAPTSSKCGTVPASYACTPFVAADIPSGSTSCTTANIAAFAAACLDRATATGAACASWTADGKNGMTPCGLCLTAWTTSEGYPNLLACDYVYLGGTDAAAQKRCRDAYKCTNACAETACNASSCDDTLKDASGSTELDGCFSLESVFGSAGSCTTATAGAGPVGPTFNTCRDDATFKAATNNCRVSAGKSTPIAKQQEYFYRGACRDNRDWAGAALPR